jgi:hypothetical protein
MPNVADKRAAREEAITRLHELLEPDTHGRRPDVYTILRHVSRSGMQRRISLVVIAGGSEQGDPPYLADISYHASCVLERRFNRDDWGIVCNGAGMDMGFEIVYNLSSRLYGGDGYALSHRWI